MESSEVKFHRFEKLGKIVGKRKSITLTELDTILKQNEMVDIISLDEAIDYLSAHDVTILETIESPFLDDPLKMYFRDIGDSRILQKSEELQVATEMKNAINELRKIAAGTTISIQKLLDMGAKLEKGEIAIDDFCSIPLRTPESTPNEMRSEVLLKLSDIDKKLNKVRQIARSRERGTISEQAYWDRKRRYFKKISETIEEIGVMYKIIDKVISEVLRFERAWRTNEEFLESTVKIAGIEKEELENIYKKVKYGAEITEGELKKYKITPRTFANIIKDYKRYNRYKAKLEAISLVPPFELLEMKGKIDKYRKKYEECKYILTKSNVRLVVNIARNYVNQGVDFLDLIQEGNHALIKAIERFDPNKGFRLSTYAIWWIRQAMTRSLAEQSQVIRFPIYIVQWLRRYFVVSNELSQTLGREPTIEEIANAMNMDSDQLNEFLRVFQRHISLENKLGSDEDSRSLQDVIENEDTPSPSFFTHFAILQAELKKLIASLPPKEAKVITLRFGLEDNCPRTLEEIGHILGLSRERIRQIEVKAFEKLRHPAKLRFLEPFLRED